MSFKKAVHKIQENSMNDENYIFKALEQIKSCLDQPIEGCVDTDSLNLSVEEAEALRRIYVESRNSQES